MQSPHSSRRLCTALPTVICRQLTSLVTALMAKLWCQKPDPVFLLVLSTVGPLVSFEALLSYYGNEIDMWGDMAVAVEDLQTVSFTLTRCPPNTRRVSCFYTRRHPHGSLTPRASTTFNYVPRLFHSWPCCFLSDLKLVNNKF